MPENQHEHLPASNSSLTPQFPPPAERRKVRRPAPVEMDRDKRLAEFSSAIDALQQAPSLVQEAIMNGLLDRAGIPAGAFEYSQNLHDQVLQYGKTLAQDIAVYERLTDKGKREAQLQTIFDRVENYTENLIQQFVLDNTSADRRETLKKTYQKKRVERIRDTYKLDLLAAQMEIAASLSIKERAKVLKRAEEYVRNMYLGLTPGEATDEKTKGIIRSLSENLVEQTQQHVLPVLEKNVREFAKQSFIKSFWNRAKQTGSFALDWVSVRFSDEAKDRMAKSMTPLAELGPLTALKKTAPIVCNFAKTAYNISLNHQEALLLLASTAGAVSFDIALTAATWGIGAGVKGLHLTGNAAKVGGTAVKSLSALSAGFAVGKTTLRPLYGMREKLSFAKLEEKTHDRLAQNG